MDLYALRILRGQRLRLALTVGGVALCAVLMLFLLSVYRGVAEGSVEYIQRNRADLWVLQRNAWNILRGSSVLPTSHGETIEAVAGVRSASPVLLLLSGVGEGERLATVFLTGYDTRKPWGGPPEIVKGRGIESDDEIVLDRAFAAKFGYKVGDNIPIQDTKLAVVGLSARTNAFVIQYAFVRLERAWSLIGFSGIATCYLVELQKGADPRAAAEGIRQALPGVEAFDHAAFVRNNVREMQTGFLPLLYMIAAIGAVVLTTILSLILSMNILERRRDFAVMKALGAPRGFLPGLVVQQALWISLAGCLIALAIFFPMVALIARVTPEISTRSGPGQLAAVVCIMAAVSLVSSLVAMQRLRSIYPLEAFH